MAATEEKLQLSWQRNAAGWARAVREGRIDSRRLVTDAAILDAALALAPQRALDIGCGEGWLCRALAQRNIAVLGVDASAPLIELARQAGGDYRLCPHAELATAGLGRFDLLLCNFALLEQDLLPLLRGFRSLLTASGRLLIQTLHPHSAGPPYQDGWRVEHFQDFGEGFCEPMPWYFRTLESWLALLDDSGWQLVGRREPVHPQTGQAASLVLEAELART